MNIKEMSKAEIVKVKCLSASEAESTIFDSWLIFHVDESEFSPPVPNAMGITLVANGEPLGNVYVAGEVTFRSNRGIRVSHLVSDVFCSWFFDMPKCRVRYLGGAIEIVTAGTRRVSKKQ